MKSLSYRQAWRYWRNGGVSPAQAFLKHSLVPLGHLTTHLPKAGLILDLGCGEGILANMVALALPGTEVVGYDLDPERIDIANRNAPSNARFEVRDIFELSEPMEAAGVILNDLVHHFAFNRQRDLLLLALKHLRPGGAVFHKDVNRLDSADLRMTRFFDSRLYPDDPLSFRTADDWQMLWTRLGVKEIRIARQRHFWPASRTLFLLHRPEGSDPVPLQDLEAIGQANTEAARTHHTVLITGASGFVGGHLARRLLAEGLDGKPVRLLVLVRRPDRMPADLAAAGAVPLYGDLNDMPSLAAACRGVAFVFHIAAEVKLTGGIDLWRNNYHGTQDLLDALRGLPIRRFIHASTMGAVDRTPTDPCTSPLDENAPPHPLSEYGRSKLKAEQLVMDSGLPYTILRVPWGYGAGMTPDTHVRFLTQGVADGKTFSAVNFPGKVSVVAADDLIDAFMFVAGRDQANHQIYFVSDGRPLPLGRLFKSAANLMGRRAARWNIPWPIPPIARKLRRFLPLTLQNLNSDVLTVNNAKIVSLGFQPKVPLRQGLSLLLQDLALLPRDNRKPVSLVTGAGGGIGRALARRMAEEGHALLLVDRDATAVQAVAAELGAEALVVDLSDREGVSRIGRLYEERGWRIDWLVNNAGIGISGLAAEIEAGHQERVVDINCTAVTALSSLALRHFKAYGFGTLINISSSASFQPLPYMSTYAASKAFTRNFTLGIAEEMRATPGVLVMNVNPSGTATGFQANASVKQNEGEVLLSPEYMAHRIVEAAYARREEVTIGRTAKMMQVAARVIPIRMQTRLWGKLMAKLRVES